MGGKGIVSSVLFERTIATPQWNFKVLSPGTGRTNNNHGKTLHLSFGGGCEQELTKSGPGARLCEGSAARDLQ